MDYKWTTREEKLKVVRFWWRQQRGICHLCQDPEQPMESYSQAVVSPWAATVEHLIPKRDGGADTVGNVRLAHRWCNNILGSLFSMNRDRAHQGLALISEKQALSNAGVRHVRSPRLRLAKPANGTLAHAIEMGEVSLPRGATLPERQPHKTDKQHLSEMDWPYMRELMRPLVAQVGFGPWR